LAGTGTGRFLWPDEGARREAGMAELLVNIDVDDLGRGYDEIADA